jgi:hypothetical protein
MLTEGWLSISDTTSGFACLPRSIAHVCRKSWKRICCGPACPRLRPCPLQRRTQSDDVALLPGSLSLWKGARQEMRCLVDFFRMPAVALWCSSHPWTESNVTLAGGDFIAPEEARRAPAIRPYFKERSWYDGVQDMPIGLCTVRPAFGKMRTMFQKSRIQGVSLASLEG